MDKTVFVRTSKGEDEMRNKTAHLSVDIKRTLLMVDGVSSIREISKRVAPSLRVSLGGIFKELLKDGYITVRQTAKVFNLPQIPSQAKTATPAKMTMPSKLSIPILKSVDDGLNELDFASGFNSGVAEVSATQFDADDQALDEEKFRAEIKARVEAEFRDEIKARVEAELRAEAMAQEEAETKQRLLDEAKAIDEARALAEERARLEAKAQAEAKTAAEEKARVAAEAKARAEAEAQAIAEEKARVAAEAKAIAEEKARVEAEAKAIAEEKARVEAEAKALAEEKARVAAEAKARAEAEAKAIAEEKARVAAEAKALAEEKARVAAEAKARAEAEAQARAELEAKIRAEAKARAEAEAKAIAEEKARIEAEIRAEAKLRVEAETKKRMEEARQLAEAQARQEAEIKSLAAAQARAEAEVQAIAEAKARIEAEIRAEAKAQIAEENKIRKELELAGLKARFAADKLQKNDPLAIDVREKLLGLAHEEIAARKIHDTHVDQSDRVGEEAKSKSVISPTERSTSATVLFFDVVGYTKLSGNKQLEVKEQFNRLVSRCLEAQGEGERLILDTGDGAAIGFMQHPEDALEVAMQFRNTLIANQHNDYPELKVRIGIHIGPVTIVKDMNGQSNMVGDAINDAQRVMNFAGTDQIFISRAYHEFISRLNEQYGDIFYYQGAQKDKHNREHHVYKLVDVVSPATQSGKSNVPGETAAVKLEPFNFDVDEEIVKAVSGNKSAGKAIAQPIIEPAQPLPDLPEPAANIQQENLHEEVTPPASETSVRSQSEINDLEKEQAKLWAEAEQEAIAAAEASSLRILQADEVPHPVIHHRPRERREPIPWGKVVAGFLLVVLATLFVAPYVFPTRGFVSKIEKSLTVKLQQPVHIGALEGRLLPVPRLDLLDISVGENNQIKVQRARVNFSMLTLLSSSKVIKSLELQGAQINAVALQDVSIWLQNAVADKAYPILKISLDDSKLEGNGIQLHAVGGEFNFNKTGTFKAAKLYANGHKLELEMDASSEKTKVSMSAHASALPLLPGWVFDDFNAKGELTNGTLSIAEIESHIAKGILRGKARIDWRSGWSVEGSLAAKNIASQSLSDGVSGDVEGTARFQMRSTELAKLADAATMDGSLAMNQGVINGIDIVETASRRSTENLPGGRTHFDELWSDFSFANDAYNFRQLKIKAGVMTAKGTLDVSKQQLSGRITADMALRSDNIGSIPMQIGGSADNPTLKMAR